MLSFLIPNPNFSNHIIDSNLDPDPDPNPNPNPGLNFSHPTLHSSPNPNPNPFCPNFLYSTSESNPNPNSNVLISNSNPLKETHILRFDSCPIFKMISSLGSSSFPSSSDIDPPPHDTCGKNSVLQRQEGNVGWPPITSYRKTTTNTLSNSCRLVEHIEHVPHDDNHDPNYNDVFYDNHNQHNVNEHAKQYHNDDDNTDKYDTLNASERKCDPRCCRRSKYIRINVCTDDTPIVRKLDLNNMQGYHHLSIAIHKLFMKFYKSRMLLKFSTLPSRQGRSPHFVKFRGVSYFLTYKARDGNWVLVGDTPWEKFTRSVVIIRMARTSKQIPIYGKSF